MILRLAWQAGLLRDEIQRLTWAQIDFLDGQIVLPERAVPIPEELAEYLADLRESADGTVFLGTAEQVIVSRKAAHLLPDVIRCPDLRPAAVLCICSGDPPDPKEAAKYLSAHDAGVTIQKVQAAVLQGKGAALPVLEQTEGGLRLRGSADR